jgi:hypothetical protein
MIIADYCLQTEDYEGVRTVFREEHRATKALKHPELRDEAFIAGRVKAAIETPTFVYADLGAPDRRRSCYLKEYELNGTARYTKVIVDYERRPRVIITAYRPDYVKERSKTELIYGKDE